MSASMEDDREILAALAAVEGARSASNDGGVSESMVAEYEAAAGATFAALGLSGGAARPVPPSGFEQRLEAFVMAKVEAATEGRSPASRRNHDDDVAPEPVTSPGAPEQRNAARGMLLPFSAFLGWTAAAALLAVVLFSREPREVDRPPATERQELLAEAPDVVTVPWNVSENGELAGDVVWSDAENEGYMRIRGLEPNDPSATQYQLWIFRGTDPGAEPHPVDGGVFDVGSPGEVVIPIDAKLPVGHAGLFAVTVEDPGGVVVSKREEIVLIAARG